MPTGNQLLPVSSGQWDSLTPPPPFSLQTPNVGYLLVFLTLPFSHPWVFLFVCFSFLFPPFKTFTGIELVGVEHVLQTMNSVKRIGIAFWVKSGRGV